MSRPPWPVSPYFMDRAREHFADELARTICGDASYPPDILDPLGLCLPDTSLEGIAYALDLQELADADLMAMEGWLEYEKARAQKIARAT